ncbi:MAG: DNA-methyltransferase [Tepidisphaeraceae bacterium]
MTSDLHCGDCLDVLRSMPDASVDMVLCSPPYESARTYGIDFKLQGQDWVDWCVERFVECYRVCSGLTCWVVEGQTRKFRYSATPILLMADLHRRGIKLRKPPAFHRVGIPGSGGPDWFRNDTEFCVCATHGKLPWSDNTAMGHPPKWAPGGAMSNRLSNGARVNQWGAAGGPRGFGNRRSNGSIGKGKRPSHRLERGNEKGGCATIPVLANPGNVIHCHVGGGVLGSPLAHENEAPYPAALCEFFIRSCCPPGGTVLDPFCGSGTTGAVALQTGRKFIGIDVRANQIELTKRRLAEIQPELIA